ncbi:serine protease inhibitor Kazal-type 9 [Prionailurus iriomotensis]
MCSSISLPPSLIIMMKSITAFAIITLAATTWAASPPEVNCSQYNRKGSGIACSKERKPICGIDHKTYSNECMFCRLNQNKQFQLRKLYDDKCITLASVWRVIEISDEGRFRATNWQATVTMQARP